MSLFPKKNKKKKKDYPFKYAVIVFSLQGQSSPKNDCHHLLTLMS